MWSHFPSFVYPECLLNCSQESATGPCPERDKFNQHPHIVLFKIDFNIIVTSVISFECDVLPLDFSDQSYTCISHLLSECSAYSISLILLCFIALMIFRIQSYAASFFSQFYPVSCYFLRRRSKILFSLSHSQTLSVYTTFYTT
jgi:hypothetical protein